MKAGTIQEFFEALVADLSREPKDDQERQQIEAEKTALRNAFIRMASTPPTVDYNTIREAYRRNGYWRAGIETEPPPPPQPGRARIVSFD